VWSGDEAFLALALVENEWPAILSGICTMRKYPLEYTHITVCRRLIKPQSWSRRRNIGNSTAGAGSGEYLVSKILCLSTTSLFNSNLTEIFY
jgi:hypothetical protein